MIVVSGTSEYGKSFVHVFDVMAEDKEEARHVATGAMNDPLGVLHEYRKFPVDPHAHVLSYKFEFIIQLD